MGKSGANDERRRKEEDERATVGGVLGKTVPPLRTTRTFTLEEEDTSFEEENTNRKKNENKCEECLSFLHNATEKVRSKEFRARLYKVVDEMCQRVFPDDAGEEDDKKIAECEALGKTYAKRAIEYVKTHEEETDEFVCEKLNLCADDDATVSAEDRFSDKEQKCEAAAAEYESKIYDAVQAWLDDGEACEDLFSC